MATTFVSFDVITKSKGIRTFCKDVNIMDKIRIEFAEKTPRTFKVITKDQYELARKLYQKQHSEKG